MLERRGTVEVLTLCNQSVFSYLQVKETAKKKLRRRNLPLPGLQPYCLFSGCYQSPLNIHSKLNIPGETHLMKYEENSKSKINIVLPLN